MSLFKKNKNTDKDMNEQKTNYELVESNNENTDNDLDDMSFDDNELDDMSDINFDDDDDTLNSTDINESNLGSTDDENKEIPSEENDIALDDKTIEDADIDDIEFDDNIEELTDEKSDVDESDYEEQDNLDENNSESDDTQDEVEELEDIEDSEDSESIEDIEDSESIEDIDEGVDKHAEDAIESADEQSDNTTKLVLYIVTDRKIYGMLNYMRSHGVNVSKIFYNINEARDTMLMQVEPSRLVVLDTGTGRFTNMASRKALIDLLGICDVDTRMSVFYTDSVIKAEVSNAEEVEDKNIQWHIYKSTSDVTANLLQRHKKETYVSSSDDDEDDINEEESLEFKGLTSVRMESKIAMSSPAITPDEIILKMKVESDTDLEGYKVRV